MPFSLKVGAKIGPEFLVRAYLKRMADPLKWIERGDIEKVNAFFGSRAAWEKIPDWDTPLDSEDLAEANGAATAGLWGGFPENQRGDSGVSGHPRRPMRFQRIRRRLSTTQMELWAEPS
ncbi:MAG TPA: hypothetical protein VEF35_07020 [Candidatus Bathyarchaeia archaeon]|nr:hypothetical protein [Candidatus Bathyarchaeia archaeon]